MRIFSKIPFAAPLAALAIAVFAPASRADFLVHIQANTGGVTYNLKTGGLSSASTTGSATAGTITDLGGGLYEISSSNIGGFSISATFAMSNSPGTNEFATIGAQGVVVKNNNSNPNQTTLLIQTSDTDFTAPTGMTGLLMNTVAAQAAANSNTNNSVKLQSWIDTNNTQWGMQQPGSDGLVNGELYLLGPTFSVSGNASVGVQPFPTPYSMSQTATINLAYNNTLFNASFTTSLAAPAPAGLVLALTGVPIIGFGTWLRRRRNITS